MSLRPARRPAPRGLRAAAARLRPDRLAGLLLIGLVQAYRYLVSPVLGPSCRYLPTCSDYAREALALHGPWRGTLLAVRRVARCHPWGGWGYDPVPPAAPSPLRSDPSGARPT